MGWLPTIPDKLTPIHCSICNEHLRGIISGGGGACPDQLYYIIWTKDSDDPEYQPDNVYFICKKHKRTAQQVNDCVLEVPPVNYRYGCVIH